MGSALLKASELHEMIHVLPDFLSPSDHQQVLEIIRPQRKKRDVFGDLQEHPFLKPILQRATQRFEVLRRHHLQQALLRFEGYTGLLHHDRNHRPDRRYSLLYYIEEPQRGGEIIFPFFDTWGEPVWSPLTEACADLHERGQYFTRDAEIEAYLVAHKTQLLHFPAKANSAVFFACGNPEMWHFVCPVEEGNRACVVLFYTPPPSTLIHDR